ncbi:hypothetical protein [Thermoflexibacter ruber]|uniref:MetA-pathway of phenol degradation n=1 Tax=Thermoflexibacter ruber TaxID=1003 RepID=A0A1I2BRG6_9BACT|nr:hypothetical protein [Thermoflexibacter ruber]SFE58756.1 hypothetical protein SAMN04488541_1003128 [Thermoflexibacter ruber]
MKKYFVLFLVLLIKSNVLACDICGCGAGSYYIGLMPQFHKNFIGVRYRYSVFDSHLGRSSQNSVFATQEVFRTTEFWARFYPHQKVQILAFLPYQFNTQLEKGISKNLQGIGDGMMIANYNVFNTLYDTTIFKHSFWLGGGIKFATGKYQYDVSNHQQVANPNFQLGTGSYDFLLTANYTIRYRKFGINADVSYKINTQNSQYYRFGNRLSANLQLFYIRNIGNVGLMPNAGFYFESSASDTRNKYYVENTGGNLIATAAGVDIFFKSISAGLNYQIPTIQNLADGQIKAQNRTFIHLTLLF